MFSDIKTDALETTKREINSNNSDKASFWQVDFEQETNELEHKQFSGVLVFRYLHRPLFASIKQAILPGGIIIYETFTQGNEKYGRPKNPDFLLAKGEIVEQFKDWQILHQFEGVVENNGNKQAIAQIVAIKPEP